MPDTTGVADLQQPGALELLRSPRPGALGVTTGPDGYPRVIPIGFLWNGTAVVVCTRANRAESRRAGETTTRCADDRHHGPARQGAPAARHREHRDSGWRPRPEYLAAAAKSTQGDELAAFEAGVRGLYKEMARITITPSWARFYDFGAGRLPTFLRRLVEPGAA